MWKGFLGVLVAALWLLNVRPLRAGLITRPFMRAYLRLLPAMSQTEKEALEAGTVWWDGELFTGAPKWEKLLAAKPPQLSAAESAFIDGPCEELCRMLDEWNITHERGDLPPQVWEFLKTRGFFAMIIPKKYGGLEFSAYAHSCVLAKIASRSATASSTVAVPNSLGPAELLNHYGTEEQKNYYLPRLARGEEVPCFALTGPRAGSDASSIPDTGIVSRGLWQGREVVGLKLNFSKRYITLAPVATVIGLAFRMFDPERLLGGKTDIGITCALIPRNTPGVSIGRRHFPLNIPFQNGPIQGKDVFVPLDFIIGGAAMAGSGWRMLVEQLSVGRCISLPSNATGGAKAGVWATGAYARIRTQFNLPVGKFEGVETVIARMVGLTYTMDAARSVTAGAIDGGEKPSVPSAMLKYHVTEMGRQVANDAMDVHGGKGICLGPRNYLGRGYQIVPVAITVEGANLLTRNLIIFGQGAVRCHPFVLREMTAARNPDRTAGVAEFDRALFGHIGFTISNAVRSFIMALTHARFTRAPVQGPTARYYQHIVRFSASFAFAVDVAMLDARRLPEEERGPVGATRRRALVHVSGLHGAQAPREPGPPRGGPADRRVGLPQSPLPRAGAAARLPAQFPQPRARGADARAHLPARARLLRPGGPSRPQRRSARDQPDRGARAAVPGHLLDARAGQPAGTPAGGAAAGGAARAAREAHPRRGRQDRPDHRARLPRARPAGARRRHRLGDRGGGAARLRSQGHGAHQRR